MPWTPASDTRAEWGTLRVIINNVDVTMFRGGGTMVTDYQFTDPYGHGPATIGSTRSPRSRRTTSATATWTGTRWAARCTCTRCSTGPSFPGCGRG